MDKITLVRHMQACADKSRVHASGLVEELAQTVMSSLTELDAAKADKVESVATTISPKGWYTDNTAGYPYYYDIAVTGVTDKDRAEVTIAPESADAAAACGLCATNETIAGYIRIRSVSVPTVQLNAEYRVEYGKE
ncbi:MAG: hypothetical protein IJA35_00860 [Clostridia bacterium]|nr:hypothetical protein [Clostridia bacterium]